MLTDINMPGVNGYAVGALFRATPGARTAPLIAMSGEPVPADEYQQAGFSAYLQKPVDFSALVKAIRKALRR